MITNLIMRHLLLPLGVPLLFLTLFLPLSAQAQTSESNRVETVKFASKLVGTTLPYNVVLPPEYFSSPMTRYPVLYLLHGLTGHYTDWTTRTNVADYAAQYRMIIVTPEGNDGWYTDSAGVPAHKYESYILNELIPDVDARYRTIQARYGRAIAGLSMGGYGALKLGLKFPGTFVFAASMSGALAAPALTETELKDPGPIRDSVLNVFGAAGSETRKANDVFRIVGDLPAGRVASLPYFYLDCGTEDGLVGDNQKFAALLREKKIPHEYRELPGNHSWAYWDQQVQEVLKIAAQKLRMPPARTPVRVRSNAISKITALPRYTAFRVRPFRERTCAPAVSGRGYLRIDCCPGLGAQVRSLNGVELWTPVTSPLA